MAVRFFSSDIPFTLKNKRIYSSLVQTLISKERSVPGDISYIFCSDPYLHKLNVDYLSHDTLTDIITFDYSENKIVSGEIYISIDRIKENAQKFEVSFKDELTRVMIHGILHLCGYKDKSKKDKQEMTELENKYLKLFSKELR